MISTYVSKCYGSFEVESNRIDQHYTYSKYDINFYSSKGNSTKLSMLSMSEMEVLVEEIATYVDGGFSVFGGKILTSTIMIGLEVVTCEFQLMCYTD